MNIEIVIPVFRPDGRLKMSIERLLRQSVMPDRKQRCDHTGTGFGYCDFYGTDGDTTEPISGREADRTV